jgi:hypothetical protein
VNYFVSLFNLTTAFWFALVCNIYFNQSQFNCYYLMITYKSTDNPLLISPALSCSLLLSLAPACSRLLSLALSCSLLLSLGPSCPLLPSLALSCSLLLSLALYLFSLMLFSALLFSLTLSCYLFLSLSLIYFILLSIALSCLALSCLCLFIVPLCFFLFLPLPVFSCLIIYDYLKISFPQFSYLPPSLNLLHPLYTLALLQCQNYLCPPALHVHRLSPEFS